MPAYGTGSRVGEKPLVVTPEEALEMNARVRDLLTEESDAPLPHDQQSDLPLPFLQNPRPLALQIIRALRDLHTMAETSILVSEEECWFLERRFRHNDREPVARAFLKKIHILLLEFHPELAPIIPEEGVEANADRTYEDAIKDSNPDSNADTKAEPDTGDGAGTVPAE